MSVLDAAAKSAGHAGHCRRSLRPCASCTRLRLSPACFVFSGLEVEHGSMTCAITKRWSKKRLGTFCLCLRHRHVRGPLCTVSRLSPMLPAARKPRQSFVNSSCQTVRSSGMFPTPGPGVHGGPPRSYARKSSKWAPTWGLLACKTCSPQAARNCRAAK